MTRVISVVCLVLLVLGAGCGGSKQAVKAGTPLPVLDSAKLSTGVKDGYYENEKKVFSASRDEKVIAWVRLKFVEKPQQLSLSWYQPDGQLYHQTEPIQINADGGYHKYSTVYQLIEITPMAKLGLLGEWSVLVDLDGRKLQNLTFVIEE